MTTCKLSPHIERWLQMVEGGEVAACKEQHMLAAYVRRCFVEEDIYTDDEQLEKYLGLVRYFPYDKFFEWQAFCLALHLTTYRRADDMPRWPDLFLMIGRGAGKDGYIAVESFCLASPYSRLPQYDIDICATAEEQAMRPVEDILAVLENTQQRAKLSRHFYWTKQKVVGLKTRGVIRGRTNNPKSKDGMRSGMVVFNEIHQFANYDNIKVFITGLGKKKHPRRLYATTNGDVRGGPLDDLLDESMRILEGSQPDNGLLPFICRIDDKKEAHDPAMWEKANPSLPYLPSLRAVIEKEYAAWAVNPLSNADLMTKRMNRPQMDTEVAVTDWDNIIATRQPLPDLRGHACVAGVDYASISDWASVCLHFLVDGKRYDISHSWLCLQSRDLPRITAPWREWAEAGLLTPVDDREIHPDLIAGWLLRMGQQYNIRDVALDNYRYALIANSLRNVGFDHADRKNVYSVRPSDIYKVAPIVDSAFVNQTFIWGDNPVLRWAANNTKLVRASGRGGVDTGNVYYAKIEGKSRKTDPFMALVHAMTRESLLETSATEIYDVPVIIG